MYNTILVQNNYLSGLHSARLLHFLDENSINPFKLINFKENKDLSGLSSYEPIIQDNSFSISKTKTTAINPTYTSTGLKDSIYESQRKGKQSQQAESLLNGYWSRQKLANEARLQQIYKGDRIKRNDETYLYNSSFYLPRNFSLEPRTTYKDSLIWLLTVNKFYISKIPVPNYMQEPEKIQENSTELKNWLTSFGAGFLAGTVARTSTAPFDRLKFIYQLYYKGSEKPPSVMKGFGEIVKRDGFRGLFRGNLMCVLKASPETSIRLTIFEKLKSLIKDEKSGKLSKDKLFIAGGLSGAIANFTIFPMDALRTRLAAAPSGVYKGVFDAIRKIIKTEGSVRSLYRGLSAGMIANLPTSGMNLTIYEAIKELVMDHTNERRLPSIAFMTFGGISALITCSLLYPLQVVASRQIMQSLLDKENKNKGMLNQIKRIYKSEGARGFYKGYCPAISKVVLGNAMSFGCFEFMKKTLGIEFKKH